ncbi:MAG: TIGR02757 family protein [Candidatus Hydrogenedentota bacterium]
MAVVRKTTLVSGCNLHDRLEALYGRLNRPEYISPDPLQFLSGYPEAADREVVGMIASCLAFGNVRQILRSVASVLDRMPAPAEFLDIATRRKLERTFAGFRHRYVADAELVDLLLGIKQCRETHGSLEALFLTGDHAEHETVLPALERFVHELASFSRLPANYLLPDPRRGSACKRLHLFLRWMIRKDSVDPGGWEHISAARLIVPLDTHMHRISRALGLTRRNAADMRTALEVTEAFRAVVPEDPVRYDFALTRLGIRGDTMGTEFLRELGQPIRSAGIPKAPSST